MLYTIYSHVLKLEYLAILMKPTWLFQIYIISNTTNLPDSLPSVWSVEWSLVLDWSLGDSSLSLSCLVSCNGCPLQYRLIDMYTFLFRYEIKKHG